MADTAHAELRLPYFKQGDDLAGCLAQVEKAGAANPLAAALGLHVEVLENAIVDLKRLQLAALANPGQLLVDACTHRIGVSGPASLIEDLLAAGTLDASPLDGDAVEDRPLDPYELEDRGVSR